MTYCLDTNVLINAWYFWYSPQSHPSFWQGLEDLADGGELSIPEQVFEELREQDDDLFQWVKSRKEIFVYISTDRSEEVYTDLVNKYPQLSGVLGMGTSYADLYVVAVAAIEGATVVTTENLDSTENPAKFKIPHICRNERIACIKPYEVIKREGWVFLHS